MSPLGVWPLEGYPLQLPTSVGYDHSEEWVGQGQYRTQRQPTTEINEIFVLFSLRPPFAQAPHCMSHMMTLPHWQFTPSGTISTLFSQGYKYGCT